MIETFGKRTASRSPSSGRLPGNGTPIGMPTSAAGQIHGVEMRRNPRRVAIGDHVAVRVHAALEIAEPSPDPWAPSDARPGACTGRAPACRSTATSAPRRSSRRPRRCGRNSRRLRRSSRARWRPEYSRILPMRPCIAMRVLRTGPDRGVVALDVGDGARRTDRAVHLEWILVRRAQRRRGVRHARRRSHRSFLTDALSIGGVERIADSMSSMSGSPFQSDQATWSAVCALIASHSFSAHDAHEVALCHAPARPAPAGEAADADELGVHRRSGAPRARAACPARSRPACT